MNKGINGIVLLVLGICLVGCDADSNKFFHRTDKSKRTFGKRKITNHEIRNYGLCVLPKGPKQERRLTRIIREATDVNVHNPRL